MDQFVTSSRPNVPQNEGHLASQAIDLTKSQLIELTTERILVELFSRVNFTSKT
jgi:type III secretion system FlhB-like substrate exporter